jgi:ATP-dependent Lhr-like helicase
MLPVLSRMLSEDWSGLSVLYMCPIKALLNNLEPRLRGYAELVGRRAAIWHGDVGQSARRKILREPPDILLTTPESVEVMLTSSNTDHRILFRALRTLIVDEVHAFAGDDRGWHLLAVAERLTRLAGRDLQRLGLSATVGNADQLLSWLAGSSPAARSVVSGPESSAAAPASNDGIELDYVGSLENAAHVISRLHRGEKRLVFCDSRSRVEDLAVLLRTAGVNTFVSHSSLGLDERRRAEEAFGQGRDAVIVATSTLELGIDVGDLDRVIQIDAPGTVASFLQRSGRTGRRPGTHRNCLFLTTTPDAFLQAAGLLQLWSEGFIEPVMPPVEPYHIFAQQLMALVLQERGIGARTWKDWIGGMPTFSRFGPEVLAAIVEHMVSTGILFNDSGILSFGTEGESRFGYRHFMDIVTVFTSDPLFAVRSGRVDLGYVHPLSFVTRNDAVPVLLLAGRSWVVTHIDWRERVAYVEVTETKGRSQWLGSGQPLHFKLCRAVRKVLARGGLDAGMTSRGQQALEDAVAALSWVDEESTAIVRSRDGSLDWWTFAGLAANSTLGAALGSLQIESSRVSNLSIPLKESVERADFVTILATVDAEEAADRVEISEDALEGLKFEECLPRGLAERTLKRRIADQDGVVACLGEPVRAVAG